MAHWRVETHNHHTGKRRVDPRKWKQNNKDWPYKRLSDAVVLAILSTTSSAKSVQTQLATKSHIAISLDMIYRIRRGERRTDISRVGTPWEHYTPTPKRPHLIARDPAKLYLDEELRLRDGFEVKEVA